MQDFTLKTVVSVAALGTVAAYIGIPNLQSPLIIEQNQKQVSQPSASDEVVTEDYINSIPEFGADGELGQWESFEAMHARYTQAFVDSEGFGISRVMTFQDPGRMQLPIDGLAYAVSKMQMIGLSKDEPVVYLPSWLNVTRNQLENYETRELTDFERASVDRFEDGESLTWLFGESNSQVTLIGALRAEQSCMECHEAADGELLGAFVYSMERVERRRVLDVHEIQEQLNGEQVGTQSSRQEL